jgi:hypothetical protein
MVLRTLPLLALLVTFGAAHALAQSTASTCSPRAAPADSTARPDVVIVASAQIDQLRFESAPRAELRLFGCDTLVVTERRNLPKPVQPGVTYRDVGIGIEIRSWLNVQCLLPALTRAGQGAATDSLRALAALCSPTPADSTRRAPAPPRRP